MQKRRKKEILLLKNNEDAANETKFEKKTLNTGLNSELSTKKCQVNNDPNSESLLCQL